MSRSKRLLTSILSSLLLLTACEKEAVLSECDALQDTFIPNEVQSLFLEVGFGQEFGQSTPNLRKWNSGIRIFVEGPLSDTLAAEIEQIIAELTALSTYIEIELVAMKEASNCQLFLGRKENYVQRLEPNAEGIAEGNSGFASIAWNSNNEIIHASACLDIVNYTDQQLHKHVLREELAQVLGLINDTVFDDNSIFYQFDTDRISYSDMDRQVIAFMLGNELKAGMCKSEVIAIVQ